MDSSAMLGVPSTPVLTVEEAASVLRIGRSLAYQMAREYDATGGVTGLPVVHFGGCLRVPRWALLELAAAVGSCGSATPPSPQKCPPMSRSRLMPAERRVVLTADTAELRQQLGTTGWVVFEELLLASTGTPTGTGGCVASVSIRALAGRLGLAKDTVARALTRLHSAGLVTARQSRTDTGVFATGSYTLHVPACITVTDHRPAASTTPRSRHTDQLALTLTT